MTRYIYPQPEGRRAWQGRFQQNAKSQRVVAHAYDTRDLFFVSFKSTEEFHKEREKGPRS